MSEDVHVYKEGFSTTEPSKFPPSAALAPITPPQSVSDGEVIKVSPTSHPSSSSFRTTLSAVDRVLKAFQDHKYGEREGGPWLKFSLAPDEYDDLQNRLKEDEDLWGYVEDKLRYDYSVPRKELVIRMPTGIHEEFIDAVEDELKRIIRDAQSLPNPVGEIFRRVGASRSTDIYIPDQTTPEGRNSKHSPDSSFRHESSKYPSIVVEVSYSQKRKDLPRLADDYITETFGSVKLVIGLDLEYRNGRGAAAYVWRPRYGVDQEGDRYVEAEVVVNAFEFVDAAGVGTNVGHVLQFDAADFVHSTILENVPTAQLASLPPLLRIPFGAFTQHLISARRRYELSRRSTALAEPKCKKRRRSSTPPEELESGDEKKYLEEEDEEEMRQERDSTWGLREGKKAKR